MLVQGRKTGRLDLLEKRKTSRFIRCILTKANNEREGDGKRGKPALFKALKASKGNSFSTTTYGPLTQPSMTTRFICSWRPAASKTKRPWRPHAAALS